MQVSNPKCDESNEILLMAQIRRDRNLPLGTFLTKITTELKQYQS